MGFDPGLADRIRDELAGRVESSEKRMFGGLAFMVRGNMCCGVIGSDLVVRIGPDRYKDMLTRPHARPMDFTGKPLNGFVYVAPRGYRSANSLRRWLDQALEFNSTLPAK